MGRRRLTRIRELVAEARQEREESARLLEGNGHPATPRGTDELRAAVETLTGEGIVLRDLDAGLVDFPARLGDGRACCAGCWASRRWSGGTGPTPGSPAAGR